MTNEILRNYSWGAGYTPMEGTDDWVTVAEMPGSSGYDWSELKAFYSPSARRYFWHSDSGCSCNSWGDEVHRAGDFENGDRDALLRAWETFAKDHEYTITTTEYLGGVTQIRNFKESK